MYKTMKTNIQDNQHRKEQLEDTEGVIRNRKQDNRQYNGQKNKGKMPNNDPQNTKIEEHKPI